MIWRVKQTHLGIEIVQFTMESQFDAVSHAEHIHANLEYDGKLDENWVDSKFEKYINRNEFTSQQAQQIGEALIEMAYMPSDDHSRNIMNIANSHK